MQRMLWALAPLLAVGCLAGKLEGPAEDHYLQTRAVADRCAAEDCSPQLTEDVTAMCDQAEAILALAEGREPTQCHPEEASP